MTKVTISLLTVEAMDVFPSGGIFRELQSVHDTGYFSGQASLEEDWHQVTKIFRTLETGCERVAYIDKHFER